MNFFFWRRKRDSELEEEISSHLRMAERDRVERGATPEKAQIDSRRQFGNVGLVRDTTRDMWGWARLERLTQDVRYAVRIARRTPIVTAAALLSLALGIGANTAIFSLTNAVVLRSLPVQNPQELEQLGMVSPKSDGEPNPIFTNPIWEQVRDHQDVFSGVFAWDKRSFDLAQGGESRLTEGLLVSGAYFTTLGVQSAAGRLISTTDDHRGCPGAAVISYNFWQQQYGGDPSAVGKTITLDRHSFEIIGVSARGFTGADVGYSYGVALPICAEPVFDASLTMLDMRSAWWLRVMGRRKPEYTPEQVSARLQVLSPTTFDATTPSNWKPAQQANYRSRKLVATPAATGISDIRRRYSSPLEMLLVVSGLVLLIACANIASLMLARASGRRKEIAVRLAMGASRARLIRQLLTECILMAFCGAVLGLLFARWGDSLLVRYISSSRNEVFLNLTPDLRVLAFTAGVAFLTALLFGVLPAFRSTDISLGAAMKGGQTEDSESRLRIRPGRWIVGVQIALSMILLVAAGLFLRTFVNLVSQDLGFESNHVLLATVDLGGEKLSPQALTMTFNEILDRIHALPGAASVSRSFTVPLIGRMWDDNVFVDDPAAPKGDNADAYFNFITPEYLATLRTPIIQGRNFTSYDSATAPRVAIVNETLARRFFPHGNVVSNYLKTETGSNKLSGPIEVVGIMKDAKYGSLREPVPPTVFFPMDQAPDAMAASMFEIRSNLPESSLIPEVQKAIVSVNGSLPIVFSSFDSKVDESAQQERLLATLAGFFGGLGLLLAMIGLYGVTAYLVSRRQKEIGIRMALGAARNSILRLVLRDVAVVLAFGLPVGVAIAIGASKFVQKMLFGLAPRDISTLAGAAAVLAVVALVAGYFPARRAARLDPMGVLREE
jgi:putative ABC transport system permease protein